MSDISRCAGVYSIVNGANGKCYIGSAHDLGRRWRQHLKSFLTGESPSLKLRRAVLKYGAESFTFKVILFCSKENCLFYEERAIAAFDSVGSGYNCRAVPYSNIGIKLPRTDAVKLILSAAAKLRARGHPLGLWPKGSRHSADARRKMSATKRKIFRQYELNGVRMCLSDWAERLDIPTRALSNRISRGWPLERALTEPSRGY